VIPDVYRGSYKYNTEEVGKKYATSVMEIIENLQKQNKGLAAFIGESLLGCGGQIVLPQGYLEHVYQIIRANGGICIADEVRWDLEEWVPISGDLNCKMWFLTLLH
jgi:4-aminobutyrate aminotransferase-like enzyme